MTNTGTGTSKYGGVMSRLNFGRLYLFVGSAIAINLAACTGIVSEDTSTGSSKSEALAGIPMVTSIATPVHPLGAADEDPNEMAANLRTGMYPYELTPLPASVDLSNELPPPGDQGSSEGSCAGFAVGYYAKSMTEYQKTYWDLSNPFFEFSPSYIFNQLTTNGAGITMSSALKLLVSQGDDALQYTRYYAPDYSTQPSTAAHNRASRFKSKSWAVIRGVAAMKNALATGSPVLIGFQVFPDFDAISSTNSVYDYSGGFSCTSDYDCTSSPYGGFCAASTNLCACSTDHDCNGGKCMSGSCSRGGHGLELSGYDDSVGAFRFRNSWGGYWGLGGDGWYSYAEITDPRNQVYAYSMDDSNPIVTSAPADSLYAVANNNLLRVNEDFGDTSHVNTSGDWSGGTALANYNGYLYVTRKVLYKVNISSGQRTTLNSEDWTGPAWMGFTWPPGASLSGPQTLFILQNATIVAMNTTTGSYSIIGGYRAFNGVSSASVSLGTMYVIQNSILYSVNLSTGAKTRLGTDTWAGATSMTIPNFSVDIMQNGHLYSVDNITGRRRQLNSKAWTSTAQLTTHNGRLFVVGNGKLWEINQANGLEDDLGTYSGGWPSTTVLESIVL